MSHARTAAEGHARKDPWLATAHGIPRTEFRYTLTMLSKNFMTADTRSPSADEFSMMMSTTGV